MQPRVWPPPDRVSPNVVAIDLRLGCSLLRLIRPDRTHFFAAVAPGLRWLPDK